MNLTTHPCLLATTFFLSLATAPAGTSPAPVAASQKKLSSEGLLNDALRSSSPAWSDWDISGQIRFRYEAKENAGSFPDRDFGRGFANDNDYSLFREKLHVGWQALPWLKFYVESRGSQAVSDERNPSPEQDLWDLQQAYVQLGNAAEFPLTLKLGRQDFIYGDQRFIGNGDWSNTGRSFDAASLRYTISKDSWIDLFSGRVVVPRDAYLNQSNDYDQFSGLYASSQELWSGVETQAFFLARNVGVKSPNAIAPGLGGPSERDVYTYGARLKSLPGSFAGWDFTFEGAGQFGHVVTAGVERDLQSFALTGNISYTFSSLSAEPRIGVGYDYASGDSNPNDSHQETFEPLFGTNHRFYGVMDLVGLRNLSSPSLSLSAKPCAKLTLTADYLLYWLADGRDSFYPESGPARSQNGYGKHPEFNSYVGSEIDLVAKYSLTPQVDLAVGYGHFFTGGYVQYSTAASGTTDADWVYLQTSVKF